MDLITLVTSVVPDRSLGFTLTVVIAGLGIVLSTLALLIIVFYTFGAVVSKTQNKAKKQKANDKPNSDLPKPKADVKPAPVTPAAPVADGGISGEVVAAISAAVYSMEGNSTATITSITPVKKQSPITSRNPWANAAVIDNTRPF